MKEEENKHQVLLLVIVSSAPIRYDRRNAIRQTWMSKCDTGKVVLMFEFLDMRYMDLIYVHGCGEMKMRMLKIAFWGRGAA